MEHIEQKPNHLESCEGRVGIFPRHFERDSIARGRQRAGQGDLKANPEENYLQDCYSLGMDVYWGLKGESAAEQDARERR